MTLPRKNLPNCSFIDDFWGNTPAVFTHSNLYLSVFSCKNTLCLRHTHALRFWSLEKMSSKQDDQGSGWRNFCRQCTCCLQSRIQEVSIRRTFSDSHFCVSDWVKSMVSRCAVLANSTSGGIEDQPEVPPLFLSITIYCHDLLRQWKLLFLWGFWRSSGASILARTLRKLQKAISKNVAVLFHERNKIWVAESKVSTCVDANGWPDKLKKWRAFMSLPILWVEQANWVQSNLCSPTWSQNSLACTVEQEEMLQQQSFMDTKVTKGQKNSCNWDKHQKSIKFICLGSQTALVSSKMESSCCEITFSRSIILRHKTLVLFGQERTIRHKGRFSCILDCGFWDHRSEGALPKSHTNRIKLSGSVWHDIDMGHKVPYSTSVRSNSTVIDAHQMDLYLEYWRNLPLRGGSKCRFDVCFSRGVSTQKDRM